MPSALRSRAPQRLPGDPTPATIDDHLPDALGGHRYDRFDHETGDFLGHAWQGDPAFVVRASDPPSVLDAVAAATIRIANIDRAGRENGEVDDLDPWTWHPDYVSTPSTTPDGVTFTVDVAGEYTQEQVRGMARVIVEELTARDQDGHVTGTAAS